MAKKFSLKNNTIFQRTEPPEDRPTHIATAVQIVTEIATTSFELSNAENNNKDDFDPQILTLRNRPSNFDPQILTSTEDSSLSPSDTPEDTSTIHRTTETLRLEENESPNSENNNKDGFDPQILTLRNRPSNFDPQNLTVTTENDNRQDQQDNSIRSLPNLQAPSSSAKKSRRESPVSPTSPPSQQASIRELDLRDHFDKSLFFSFYNEMSDELLPTLNASEQVLYHRLFRLAYGFNRNYCTVSQSALEDRTNLSRNTIRTAMQSLIKEGLIRIVESNNRTSTTYRVVLLREKGNRGVNFEQQIMPVKIRGAKFDQLGGQISDLQNLTPRNKNGHKPLENGSIEGSIANFEGQNLTPLLSLTHRSFTLSHSSTAGEREGQNLLSKNHLTEQNLTTTNLNSWAQELVNRFYSLLGQRVTKKKRERNLQECITLLQEDCFSVEEIDYAISWLVAHHPTTGDFSRLSYFIGQALKDREKNQQLTDEQQQRVIAARHQQEEEQKTKEDQQKLEKIKSSIAPETLEALTEEAQRLVTHQYPKRGIGQEMLIRLKLEELIKERYG